MIRKLISTLLLAGIVSGCETVTFTPQEIADIENGDRVIIKLVERHTGNGTMAVTVGYINNLEIPEYDLSNLLKRYLLPVGANKIEVNCRGTYKEKAVDYTKEVEVLAMPARRYTLVVEINSDLSCFMKVEEQAEMEFIRA